MANEKLRIGVYPGSFDPITYGHIDVIERSLTFLDKIIIAVANNSRKSFIFSLEERINLIKSVFEGREEVKVFLSNDVQEIVSYFSNYFKEKS